MFPRLQSTPEQTKNTALFKGKKHTNDSLTWFFSFRHLSFFEQNTASTYNIRSPEKILPKNIKTRQQSKYLEL